MCCEAFLIAEALKTHHRHGFLDDAVMALVLNTKSSAIVVPTYPHQHLGREHNTDESISLKNEDHTSIPFNLQKPNLTRRLLKYLNYDTRIRAPSNG